MRNIYHSMIDFIWKSEKSKVDAQSILNAYLLGLVELATFNNVITTIVRLCWCFTSDKTPPAAMISLNIEKRSK
ncbi:hypothetical protein V511_06665 [Mesotoga sp. Brook.08.YT.4.2.5.1]|uniref:hypothetical protein n=1 Tax=unclassified Mesotoga TaxID=1184398 RepID=UPI000B1679AC|nr:MULTISPECIES: hypothetical protein [unclassified Mesotoga]PNE22628.1 hypothetical protein V511_06665 [Mesotoga sp. Brook.08.YT.4.2.5.1]RAM59032.1 hypothetical protein DS65_01655 [Mesotoga sp. SC_4PWL113PWK15]PVD16092.1 hypothetical protein V512_003975 [Mesotoga sp. Brook.08.105.5.1]RAO95771.1 hypothetical protein M388_04565 [Mesotoga sp. Brook.08.YT.4.2.5.4.]RDI94136.1 hypothetical protein Q502_01260 [Mesotoga sp. Brook.08.YT.4.2.5.2.]